MTERAGIQAAKEADCKSVTPDTPLVQLQPGPPFVAVHS